LPLLSCEEIETCRCIKSLWIGFDLDHGSPVVGEILNEVHEDRRGCQGFLQYEPGSSPHEHRDLYFSKRQARTNVFIGFIGWALGILSTLLCAWLMRKLGLR